MANSNIVTASNDVKIDNCILELSNYLERLKVVFTRLDDTMDSTSSIYKSEDADELRRKYSLFRDNYSMIVANVQSYIDELRAVKTNYNVFSDELSNKVAKDAVNMESGYNRYQS
jgi:hypothetical protein